MLKNLILFSTPESLEETYYDDDMRMCGIENDMLVCRIWVTKVYYKRIDLIKYLEINDIHYKYLNADNFFATEQGKGAPVFQRLNWKMLVHKDSVEQLKLMFKNGE